MARFETGKTYTIRCIGDHNLNTDVVIEKRTAKFITFTDCGQKYRIGIHENGDEEFAIVCSGFVIRAK